MTSNFNERKSTDCSPTDNLLGCSEGSDQSFNTQSAHSANALNDLKRDRFELLSAYLDGEVSADERRQVEALLATDLTAKRLYSRLLALRQGLRSLPIPASEQPVEQMVQQVVTRLERRPRRQLAWGGLTIAAMFVGALAGLPHSGYSPQVAQAPEVPRTVEAVPTQGLMIALNEPVFPIPKATISTPNGQTDIELGTESNLQ